MQREARRRSTRYTAVGERGRRTGIDGVSHMPQGAAEAVHIGEYFNNVESNQPFVNGPEDFPEDFRIEDDSNASLMSLSSANDERDVNGHASMSPSLASREKDTSTDPLSDILSAAVDDLPTHDAATGSNEDSRDISNNQLQQDTPDDADHVHASSPVLGEEPLDAAQHEPARRRGPLFARFAQTTNVPVVEAAHGSVDDEMKQNNDDDDDSPFIDGMSYTASTPLPAQSPVPSLARSSVATDSNDSLSAALDAGHEQPLGRR
ncbi:hypothetical protein SYNPS1DRAFT_31925 [Syncephalis pseudoplumigaleata]|uniref:Uncharacterized protein n=1 Tax=Syncephalis pseudoplumigaleata TaxID=1712513 RepID=A0A4P9YRI8_9FUNG|nr:hypothetical protein SYNPS1DRAFT_31925 [Syncephalis pseudoplumigaleata]|eukprot:RKP22476.1 hypothetical protein SYNPS1DRAFT_31925 [Syncephalis pseudoplumigaleata]